jgi:hypothetical protein
MRISQVFVLDILDAAEAYRVFEKLFDLLFRHVWFNNVDWRKRQPIQSVVQSKAETKEIYEPSQLFFQKLLCLK